MAEVLYEESGWPIVVITLPPHELTQREFERFLDRVSAYQDRGQVFGMLFDLRGAPVFDTDRRRALAERVDRDIQRYGRVCPAAVVTSSPVHRAVLKTLLWLMRSRYSASTFSTVEAARSWLKESLHRGQKIATSRSSTSP